MKNRLIELEKRINFLGKGSIDPASKKKSITQEVLELFLEEIKEIKKQNDEIRYHLDRKVDVPELIE